METPSAAAPKGRDTMIGRAATFFRSRCAKKPKLARPMCSPQRPRNLPRWVLNFSRKVLNFSQTVLNFSQKVQNYFRECPQNMPG